MNREQHEENTVTFPKKTARAQTFRENERGKYSFKDINEIIFNILYISLFTYVHHILTYL